MSHLASHIMVELFEVDPLLLDDPDRLRVALVSAAEAAGCTVFGSVQHKFEPQGASVVVLVGESHLSIHTWPEHRYAAFDIFTCGVVLPERGVEAVVEALQPARHRVERISRGAKAELA